MLSVTSGAGAQGGSNDVQKNLSDAQNASRQALPKPFGSRNSSGLLLTSLQNKESL